MKCPFCHLKIGDKVDVCPYCRMPISESAVVQVTPSAQWKCTQCGSKDIYYDLGFIYRLHLPSKHLKTIVPRCVHCRNMGTDQIPFSYSYPPPSSSSYKNADEIDSIEWQILSIIVFIVMIVVVFACFSLI